MKKLDKKALAGPLEDLTALLVVSIGIAILLASVGAAFTSVNEDNDDKPEEGLNDLIYALRNYKKLTLDNTGQGIFSALKLTTLNATLIAMDLNIEYEFRLEFQEKSSYNSMLGYSTQTEKLPDVGQEGVLFRTTPVGISNGGFVHAGVMIVAVWGF